MWHARSRRTADSETMAKDNFREEIPWQLRKFMELGTGLRPQALKIKYMDAMNWLYREHFANDPAAFIKQRIEPFVKGLRYDTEVLSECKVDLLDDEDDGTTR